MIEDPPKIQVKLPIVRPTPIQVVALTNVPTGFIVDALGGAGALDYRIKPIIPERADFCGPAIVCHAGPADNLALFAALEHLQTGDVLVAACNGYTGCAVTGDLLLGMAGNCGAVGFVTDGCVRDLPGIRSVGMPCFAVGVSPNSPARTGPGTVAYPVTLGAVGVACGDIICGDQDGVVVVPHERIDEVIARLAQIQLAEANLDTQVKAGLRSMPGLKF